MAWIPELVTLFHEIKFGVTSSPVLTKFDPEKLTLLKTNCSTEGIGCILMQPDGDDKSQHAMRILRETDEFLFDRSKNGARLKPIAFGSIFCTDFERKYNSFVRETACGRW